MGRWGYSKQTIFYFRPGGVGGGVIFCVLQVPVFQVLSVRL